MSKTLWRQKSAVMLQSAGMAEVECIFGCQVPDRDYDAADLEVLSVKYIRSKGRDEVETELLPTIKRFPQMMKELESRCWTKLWSLL